MRYRPFAHTGIAVSVLSLSLDGHDDTRAAGDWRDLMHAAFEEGINAFEINHPTTTLLRGVAEGVAAVQRRLLFLGLRVESANDAAHLADQVGGAIGEAHIGTLDLLTVDAAPGEPRGMPAAMRALRDHGLVRSLAVAGDYESLIPHVERGDFDALVTSFNILSGWRERHMTRTAMERQMAVIGVEPCPSDAAPLAQAAEDAKPKLGWFSKPAPQAASGTYGFLEHTNGWTAEQLCLGYALTEPSLASVQMTVAGLEHLTSLAEITERDLPAAVAAQIEMARFSAERASGVERRSTRRTA
jgi:aryl-alcohol dehydrogenase-like predicted oxidoreductase